MPGDVMVTAMAGAATGAAGLAEAIRGGRHGHASATVVGYGTMGRQYVAALGALGVGCVRVVSRSDAALEPLRGSAIKAVAGGIDAFGGRAAPEELGIVAAPIPQLIPAAERLIELGFRRLLIEKPVSLWSEAIDRLARRCEAAGVEAAAAYNRAAYPSVIDAAERAAREGGVTSCRYTFTELVRDDWLVRFTAEELARWGIANSVHPISLAHALIGAPATWSGQRAGRLSWHPAGAVFTGSGSSERGVPFSYHADWGSKGRWSVEVFTRASAYRLCPLERLFEKTSPVGEWTEVPVEAAFPTVKAGIVEQVAAMLDPALQRWVAPLSLARAAALTRFAEGVFGYSSSQGRRIDKVGECS